MAVERKKINKEDLKKLVAETVARLEDGPGLSDRKVKEQVTRELSVRNLHAKQADVRRFIAEAVHDSFLLRRFTATLRHARISERKMRLVTDQIRGKDVNLADSILKTSSKRAAYFHRKLLQSAIANATFLAGERRIDLDVNKLHVVEAQVTPGTQLKRSRPSSERRPYLIRKRTANMLIVLEEREPKPSKAERGRKKEKAKPQIKPQTQPPAPAAAAPESKEKK